jgi:hypothetical protein
MTQAFNLAQFANKLNTSGQTDNTGLQNSAVTVTAGTGMSGGGSVALGSSVTLTNAGVTSVTAGTGISVSAGTGGVTITNTAPAGGGVTSLNGQTGAITDTGLGVIGSYITALNSSNAPGDNQTTTYSENSTVAGSSLRYAFNATNKQGISTYYSKGSQASAPSYNGGGTALSGTWRYMSFGHTVTVEACANRQYYWFTALLVRIS